MKDTSKEKIKYHLKVSSFLSVRYDTHQKCRLFAAAVNCNNNINICLNIQNEMLCKSCVFFTFFFLMF